MRTEQPSHVQPRPKGPQLSSRAPVIPQPSSRSRVHSLAAFIAGEPVRRGPIRSVSSEAVSITFELVKASSRIFVTMSRSTRSAESAAGAPGTAKTTRPDARDETLQMAPPLDKTAARYHPEERGSNTAGRAPIGATALVSVAITGNFCAQTLSRSRPTRHGSASGTPGDNLALRSGVPARETHPLPTTRCRESRDSRRPRRGATLHAQDHGPGFVLQGEGGLITALALDPSSPSTIYTATARGLFQSRDSGATWRPSSRGLEGRSVLALAVDTWSTGTLYATTDGGGVYRSIDHGVDWKSVNQGLTARYVGAIAFDPSTRGTLYAGAESGRIFRSIDAGDSWSEVAAPTNRVSVTALAVDPANPQTLFVGHQQRGHLPERRCRGHLDPHARTTEQGHGLEPRRRSDEGLDRVRDDARRPLPQRRLGADVEGAAQDAQELERARPRHRPGEPAHALRGDRHRHLQVARSGRLVGHAEPRSLRQRPRARSAVALGRLRRNPPRRAQDRRRREQVGAAATRTGPERLRLRGGRSAGVAEAERPRRIFRRCRSSAARPPRRCPPAPGRCRSFPSGGARRRRRSGS